jgi:hypothetical protein
MAQVVECLPSKFKALSSIPTTTLPQGGGRGGGIIPFSNYGVQYGNHYCVLTNEIVLQEVRLLDFCGQLTPSLQLLWQLPMNEWFQRGWF